MAKKHQNIPEFIVKKMSSASTRFIERLIVYPHAAWVGQIDIPKFDDHESILFHEPRQNRKNCNNRIVDALKNQIQRL